MNSWRRISLLHLHAGAKMHSGAETMNIGSSILVILRYQVMRAMDEQSVTQVELAKRMGCTQQYVSNLLKGSSNMTLETIARLENALSIDLIKSALTYVHGYGSPVSSRPQYLNDSAGEELDPDIKTSDYVDGYRPRRKSK